MKTKLLFFLTLLSLVSCSNNSSSIKTDPVFQLPPETQVGANTFGVTIKGKVYIPRDPTGYTYGPAGRGMRFWASPDTNHSYDELVVVDGASTVGFKITIHLQNLFVNGAGQYSLKSSNFQNQGDSVPFNHIFFKIFDYNISNYAYYGSIENLGEINITRYSNDIVSGNFKGKFVRYDNPNEFIEITDGRFDIGPGILTKVFP